QRRGRDGLAAAQWAEPQGVEALVLGDPAEELQQPAAVAGPDQIPQRLLDGARNERGAKVEIALEPLQGELIDERDYRVGEGAEREEQGNNEPQRKPHGSLWKIIVGSCTLDVPEPWFPAGRPRRPLARTGRPPRRPGAAPASRRGSRSGSVPGVVHRRSANALRAGGGVAALFLVREGGGHVPSLRPRPGRGADRRHRGRAIRDLSTRRHRADGGSRGWRARLLGGTGAHPAPRGVRVARAHAG